MAYSYAMPGEETSARKSCSSGTWAIRSSRRSASRSGRTSGCSTSTGTAPAEHLRMVRRDRTQRHFELIDIDAAGADDDAAAPRGHREQLERAAEHPLREGGRRLHLVVGAVGLGPLLSLRQRRQPEARADLGRVARRAHRRRRFGEGHPLFRRRRPRAGRESVLLAHLPRQSRRHRHRRCSTRATRRTTRGSRRTRSGSSTTIRASTSCRRPCCATRPARS